MNATPTPFSLPTRSSIADMERYVRSKVAREGAAVVGASVTNRRQRRHLDMLARHIDESCDDLGRSEIYENGDLASFVVVAAPAPGQQLRATASWWYDSFNFLAS